jgi:hypothetical protein
VASILNYITTRSVYKLVEFFRDWYVGSFFLLSRLASHIFRVLDRNLALRINLHHFFEPLYQDRTVIGYILGFIFRSLRLLIGLVSYFVLFVAFVLIYVAWCLIPVYLVYEVLVAYGLLKQ